ncbi:fat atypical cadherin 2 [Anaeramoeba flamelloides]|uniref:Fat atypical cadherin 2 n=1 Tax=Anaeramoeba flamelloides TaxID=1746091 RepID=A0ABQ8YMB1_9EUKA|nr:fat atypical cadherin 2 [Anaeramoeba flamelloides]
MTSELPLLGWWKMDEGNGKIIGDSSENGIQGAITGPLNWDTGPFADSSAIKFEGQSYISFVYKHDQKSKLKPYIPTTNLSFSLWFSTTSQSGGLCVVTNGNRSGYDRHIWLKNGCLNFNCWSEVNFSGKKKVNDNSWHNVIYVINENVGLRCYVDGELYAENAKKASNFDWATTWHIGTGFKGRDSNNSCNFTGKIGNPILFNCALDENQVREIASGNIYNY